MTVKTASDHDLKALVALALQLWPENTAEALEEDFSDSLRQNAAQFFLLYDGNEAIGFAQCGLRHDYVEGTASCPVGYLEGIYVQKAHRRKGCAGQLLRACESWAAAQGCREFASDCELDNATSLAFHLGAGFQEANRIICFTKKLT